MNITQEQSKAIETYLRASIACDEHMKKAVGGFNQKYTKAVEAEVDNLKKLFSADEVKFLTCKAYHPELIKAFVK